jgi:hypothetical protein
MTCCRKIRGLAKRTISRSPRVFNGQLGNIFVSPVLVAFDGALPNKFVMAINEKVQLATVEAGLQPWVCGSELDNGIVAINGDFDGRRGEFTHLNFLGSPSLVKFGCEATNQRLDGLPLSLGVRLDSRAVCDASLSFDSRNIKTKCNVTLD